MLYTWYRIFNKTEFLATGLVSKTYTLNLEGIGQQDVLVTNGLEVGITHDGVFLLANFNGNNPFAFEGKAIYIDQINDVYLGIEFEA